MGLVATLAAIDTENSQIAGADAAIEAAQLTKRTSRTSRVALEGNLEADIREINTDGLGGKIAAGFLEAVPDGESKDFEWTGGAGNRLRVSFTYEKDTDTLSNILYVKAPKDRDTGEL